MITILMSRAKNKKNLKLLIDTDEKKFTEKQEELIKVLKKKNSV